MSSITQYKQEEIRKDNPIFSGIRSTIESTFYGNNVVKVTSLNQAYHLAKNSPGTVITDLPIYKAKELGLDDDAKVLGFNDGAITGRYAKARVIIGDDGVDEKKYEGVAREASFNARYETLYHAEAVVGLDHDFMVKAHLLIPKGYENTLYNWMLNFQYMNEQYKQEYKDSKPLPEGDIFVLSLPDYYPDCHKDGLALFDSDHNCALLCGMRYFGEHKKATLTLGWSIANRNGYAACHGGLKKYRFDNHNCYTVGVFGLSGSGKSTLTHDKHDGKYDIAILHDDAYIISTENGSSIALEPAYFDKTQDYPTDHPANKYLLSVQNVGFTKDVDDQTVIVTEDIRNGNGRALKSVFWTDNRVNKIDEPVDAIIWLMKDATLPPVVKINNPVLASVMGATLATKRTTAERLDKGVDMNALVIEPYANPFRTYPLKNDYEKFKDLFEQRDVACYILNTGHFLDKKIPKEVTLGILEAIAKDELKFETFGNFKSMAYVDIPGYEVDLEDNSYKEAWKKSLQYRKAFLEQIKVERNGRDNLPDEALDCILELEKQLDL